MSTPLGPSERDDLQNINQQLASMIKEGNYSQLFEVRKELKELAENKNIPPSVKEKLQEALKDMQGGASGPLTSQNLTNIKSNIDQVLDETKGPESGQLG